MTRPIHSHKAMDVPVQDTYLSGGAGGTPATAKEKRKKKLKKKGKKETPETNEDGDGEDDGDDGDEGGAAKGNKSEAKKKTKKTNPDEQVLAKGVRALDIKIGDGEEVMEGRRIRMAYVGRLDTPHGTVFDKSAKGDWFAFKLGRKC